MKDREIMKPLPIKNGINTIGLSPLDPLGSYTGRPEDPFESPVQDADDL